jgi:hypothetical protein
VQSIHPPVALLSVAWVRLAAARLRRSSRRAAWWCRGRPPPDAGAAILAEGGNAIDAAVATAFALAVTHPSAGNLGGGGFMIVRMANGASTTFDYRERAPLASTRTMYLDAQGEIDRALTARGWLAPGVPGTVRGMAMAHAKLGKLAWARVLQPAIDLATGGFVATPGFARGSTALRGHRRVTRPRWRRTQAGAASGRPVTASCWPTWDDRCRPSRAAAPMRSTAAGSPTRSPRR